MVCSRTKAPKPVLVGKTIEHGALLLREVLGSGAYGTVYRAVDLHSPTRTEYAVKCVEKKRYSKSSVHYLHELVQHKAANDIGGVIKMHRAFETTKYLFIIFDFCPGGDLFGAIAGNNLFWRNDTLVKNVMIQLIDTVEECHKNGIFHRDIKPENVLFSQDRSKVWLADFGLATSQEVTKDYRCGSLYYMSPESIEQDNVITPLSSRRSDMWALGIVLVNMLSGRNPWRSACYEDGGYVEFLYESDYLLSIIPISRPANILLRRVFALNPMSRPSLRELRSQIINMRTFFMNPEDIPSAQQPVQECVAKQVQARYLSNHRPPPSSARVESELPSSPFATLAELEPVDLEEEYVYGGASEEAYVRVLRPYTPVRLGSSTCTLESAGPITPESIPVIDVEDVSPIGSDIMGVALAAPVECKKRRSFLRTAFQKLKVL